MRLPLSTCQQFGQFAYQNGQQGIEAMTAIQDFMEEYHHGNEPMEKSATITRNRAGVITAAKSVKLLPNMLINLKALINDAQERSKEATNITTIVIGGAFSDWIFKVGAVLYLIQFAIGLRTVKLDSKQHAAVLVALHHLCRGELNLEIPLSELQAKMRDHYHFSLSTQQLDEILDDLGMEI